MGELRSAVDQLRLIKLSENTVSRTRICRNNKTEGFRRKNDQYENITYDAFDGEFGLLLRVDSMQSDVHIRTLWYGSVRYAVRRRHDPPFVFATDNQTTSNKA